MPPLWVPMGLAKAGAMKIMKHREIPESVFNICNSFQRLDSKSAALDLIYPAPLRSWNWLWAIHGRSATTAANSNAAKWRWNGAEGAIARDGDAHTTKPDHAIWAIAGWLLRFDTTLAVPL
jgi:hypothetical protein